jgi:translation initiation factor 2-alpha kinase 3
LEIELCFLIGIGINALLNDLCYLMSSFFRNPNDVTDTEDQTYSETTESGEDSRDDEDEHVAPPTIPKAKTLRKIETLGSTSTSTPVLSRPLSRDVAGGTQETSEWIMRALIEEKCLNDALADFEKRNLPEMRYTKDHPDVQALAKAKYEYMTQTLGKLEVLPAGPERRDSVALAVKQQVRDGLDILSSQSPQPDRPALMHRDASHLSIHSGIDDLVVREVTSRSIGSSHFYQQESMNQSMDAIMGLPPLLRPLVDHPMFELSRYLRDFTEVCMIGKGGYGKVYQVQHRLDGSNYAVKKINLKAHHLKRIQERGQSELDTLLNELRTLAKFDHPNIVRYYGGWLEYCTMTPFPSPAPNGKLMIEAPPNSSADTSAGAERSDGGDRFFGSVDTQSVRERPRKTSIDIMFERSGGEILGDIDEMDEHDDLVVELQPQIKANRRRANSGGTIASVKSKLSSVHSAGPDDEGLEAVGYALQVMYITDSNEPSLASTGDSHDFQPKPEPDSVLTLHIQMALHPLSLAEYLTPGATTESKSPGPAKVRHCFHLNTSLQILLSILDGVQYLHECGVVHRDLKPSNVFLTLNPSFTPACIDLSKCPDCKSAGHQRTGFLGARIGDFGLVTEIVGAADAPPSKAAVGTELYRPLQAGSSTSEKLDVFALGIIATELCVPFGTRMERHGVLQDVRAGKLDDNSLVLLFGGEKGRRMSGLIGDMTCADEQTRLSCAQVRERLEEHMT